MVRTSIYNTHRAALFLLVAASLAPCASSFSASVPISPSSQRVGTTSSTGASSRSALMLVPGQGSQLVAASCASMAQEEEVHAGRLSPELDGPAAATTLTPTHAARAFIAKIFSRKSAAESDVSAASGWPSLNSGSSDRDDVVYYPVCGFRWVSVDGHGEGGELEKKYKVVPTTSTASCPIRRRDEVVVGWFNQACFLDNMDDEWSYCHKSDEQGEFE